MLRKYIWIVLVFGAALVFSACGGSNTNTAEGDLGETPLDSTQVSEQVTDFIVSLPNPIQVANLIKNAGARYEEKLLNPESNVNNYKTQNQQAINLGVYSADLSFSNVYDKKQESLKYFSVVRKLSESIAVGNVFTKNLQNRVNSNQDKQDSLENIFSETFTRLHSELRANNREKYLALMFVGGWVESVYLASELWKFNPSKTLSDRIAEQGLSLKDLIKMVEEHKSEEGFSELNKELTELDKIFDSMREDYKFKEGDVKKDAKTDAVQVENKAIFNYTDDQIKQINQKVVAIRKGLVS